MKRDATTVAVFVIRVLGSLLGAYVLFTVVRFAAFVGDDIHRWPLDWMLVQVLLPTLFAMPLVVPWRFIRRAVIWWPLFAMMCFDVAWWTYTGIRDFDRVLAHRDRFEQVAASVAAFLLFCIVALQIFAVLQIRKKQAAIGI